MFLRAEHAIHVQYSMFLEAFSLSIRPTLFMKRELLFPFARAQVSVEWMQPRIAGDDDADDHAEFAEEFAEDLLGAPAQCETLPPFSRAWEGRGNGERRELGECV